MANTEAFENHAAAFENWFETHRWAYLSELNAVRALLPQEGVGIEIGVGSAFVVAIIDRTSPLGQRYERRKEASVFYRGAHFHSADEVAGIMRSAGFEDLVFRQTLFGDPADMEAPDEIRDGYGEGAFVVIGGIRSR